jgi:hypothetical protein
MFAFLPLTAADCREVIPLPLTPHTYFVSLVPGDPICFNSTDVGTHFIYGERNLATFTFFNATDSSTIAHRSTSAWLSLAINATVHENVTFTTATFPNTCTIGVYYSNLPNSEISVQEIRDYDDRCLLVHSYRDSTITASWDTEEGHDFVVLNQNADEHLSGVGSRTFSGSAVSVRFTTDFAGLSRFVRIESSSNAVNERAGTGNFPKFRPLVPSKTQLKRDNEKQMLSLGIIIAICSVVVVFLATVLAIGLYCLCRPVKHDIGHFDAPMMESRADVRVQSLVDSEDHSQSDDALAKATEVAAPVV